MKSTTDNNRQDRELAAALLRLISKLGAHYEFQDQVKRLTDSSHKERHTLAEKEEYVRETLPIIRAGAEAGYFSEEEYVYYVSFLIEGMVHDTRWIEDVYQDKLGPILQRMNELEIQHGLKPGENWRLGEGPEEYQKLSEQYEQILDSYRVPLYQEFGEGELARLLDTEPERFEALQEAGRKALFKLTSPLDHLHTLIETYRRESQLAAEVKAYYAACGVLGAALEALLLALCFQRPTEAEKARQKLPKKDQPKTSDPSEWGLNQLVNVAAAAGWLPIFTINSVELDTVGWINLIRSLRNLLHPGNHIRNKPRVRIGQREFEDAQAVYVLVQNQLNRLEEELSKS